MPIAALPQTAIRAIGSTSALSDPCSVIKELIDNSLDASATSVSVEISPNTLDIIQVKDNGFGIQPDDREFVCRPNYTSKIQTLEDLGKIGGKSLGFRGAALAGVAEMSGEVMVTTRVDGEVVAVVLKYGRTGELLSKEKASHARGTTFRVSNFLKDIPVREQMVLKIASKTIMNIKKMLQTYAIARPSVRLSIRVLKGKGDAGNWVYGPTPKATVVDAASKVAGPDVAAQCILRAWPNEDGEAEKGIGQMAATTDGEIPSNYKLVAYLPSPKADFQKTSRVGHYIAVDGRPVSVSKGVPRDIVKLFKSHLRSLWAREGCETAFSDTFICMHIYCPSGSYDVNVEPSKDEVLFENSSTLLSLAGGMFSDIYGEVNPDDKTERRNGKHETKISRQENAFDVLLARRSTAGEPSSEQRRSIALQDATNPHEEEPRSRRYSHHSIADGAEGPYEDRTSSASPWAMPKRNIPIRSSDNNRPILSPRRQQQLLTPAREQPSPIRSISAREPPRPSFLPSPSHPQIPRVGPSSPEATPLAAKSVNPRDFGLSANLQIGNQAQKSPRRGYEDEAIATWVRDSSQHIDGSQPFSDLLSDNGEKTPGPAPQRVIAGPPDRACGSPEVTGGIGKPFRLPLKPPDKARQPSVAVAEREDTPQLARADEEHSLTGSEPARLEYPGFERVSTLIRDPSKETFTTQFDATLDYERRKKAINQRLANESRSQSTLIFPHADPTQDSVMFFPRESKKSPHKSRYLAAKAALAAGTRQQGSEREKEKSTAQSGGLAHDDPRAYYIRNRDKMQESSHAKTGLKIKRTQTHRLPLESIPDDCKLHHLISTCSVRDETIPSLINESRNLDTYIQSGAISSSGCGFIELSQKDYATWEAKLGDLLRQTYRNRDGNIPVDISLDLRLSDGETYGFV